MTDGRSSVASTRTVVALPDPFGPSMSGVAPVRPTRLTPSSAVVAPYLIAGSSVSIASDTSSPVLLREQRSP